MIIPTVLQRNLDDIKKNLQTVKGFTRLAQIDVADGKLVEGETFLDLGKILEIETPIKFDIHLMVKKPFRYLKDLNNKVVKVSAHIEAPINHKRWLKKVRGLGYKAGISINPETHLEKVEKLVPNLDFVQFLTVKPGKQGSPFQSQVLQTIREFHQKYPETHTQVDGGITKANIEQVLNAGANNVVIGSAIFGAENPLGAYKNFERILKTYGKLQKN